MQTADCDVMIGKFKDTVPRTDVTPAEVQYLIHEHQDFVGQCPVINLRIKKDEARVTLHNGDGSERGSRNRTAVDEKSRLKATYDSNPEPSKNKVEKMFPGVSPNLPDSFAEVVDKEGNYPFDKDGKVTIQPVGDQVQVGNDTYSKEELAQLVAAGRVALKLEKKGKQAPSSLGQKITPTNEEEGK